MDTKIVNPSGELIDYSFSPGHLPERRKDWIVIMGHGVTGNKDRPIVRDVSDASNAAGFDTLRFSFSGNGDSEGSFGDSTITKEVGDLGAVLDAVAGDYPNICYAGHSMGGAVGVLVAAVDPRIRALISLAGMVDTRAFAKAEFGEEIPDRGFMWEDESCPLTSKFMKDLCDTVHTVTPQAERIQIPWLLLHGTADDVVLPRDSELIREIKKEAVDLFLVDGADHSFNEPGHKAAVTEAVVTWLKKLVD